MKKQTQKQIVDLDEFDKTISLWQLIPSGEGRGLKRLKVIIDSLHNSRVQQTLEPFSLLIAGSQGTRTHARCILRALGLEFPLELPSSLVQSTANEVFNFFSPTRFSDSYIISAISLLYPSILKTLYEVISTGEFSKYDNIKRITEVVPVFRPIVMTTHVKDSVPSYFQEKIDHIVELEDYTDQQLLLIVLQRLKYCNLDYKEEKVLKLIVEHGMEKLHTTIRLLKNAITVMLADSRTTLTVEDVKNVMSYS
jgi:hypothetical protein